METNGRAGKQQKVSHIYIHLHFLKYVFVAFVYSCRPRVDTCCCLLLWHSIWTWVSLCLPAWDLTTKRNVLSQELEESKPELRVHVACWCFKYIRWCRLMWMKCFRKMLMDLHYQTLHIWFKSMSEFQLWWLTVGVWVHPRGVQWGWRRGSGVGSRI